MKNNFFFILPFIVISYCLEAQGLYSGRKYGFSFSAPMFSFFTTNDSGIRNAGSNLGYGISGHVEFPVSNNINIVSGVSFRSNVGGRMRHEIGGNLWPEARLSNPIYNTGVKPLPDNTRLRYKVNVLEVPFGTKFYSGYKNSRQYFAELPVLSMGFRLNARGDISASGLPDTRDEHISSETRFMHFALGGTLGVQYDLGAVQFEVGLTAQYWLTDLTRNNGIRVIETGSGIVTQDILASDRPFLIGIRAGLFF